MIFEVRPALARKQDYLDVAERLQPQLEEIDGFLSIERFQSMSDDAKLLSLSFWRDEEAVRQWRNLAEHRGAQIEGRNGIFDDYRLRVAEVDRDYGLHDRAQAPRDSRERHFPGE